MDNRFQRKVQTRKFAIDNSWHASPVQPPKEEAVSEQPQDENQRRWDSLIENLLAADGAKFNDGYWVLSSHRKVLGPVIIFIKRAIRKLLKIFLGWYLFPIYARQSFFNGKIVNAVAMEREILYSLNDQIAALRDEAKSLRQEIDAAKQTVDGYKGELAALSQRNGEQFSEEQKRVRKLETGFDALCRETEGLKKKNADLCQVTDGLKTENADLRRETERLKKKNADLYRTTDGLKTESADLRGATDGMRQDISTLLEDGERVRDRLCRIENLPTDDDEFYHEFEERFRGSRDEIRDRLQIYIPYIKEYLPDWTKGRFIDVGSGRGEWLDILKENGATDYIGVDLNARQNAVAESFGHRTVCEDCIQYLSRQPDESVDLISGFQVIEHLCMSDIMELLRQSCRVLKKGGMILFETQNPRNLVVGADTFYIDPSHKRLLDPRMVEFFVQWCGYKDVRIIDANSHSYWSGLSLEGRDEKDIDDIKKINDIFWLIYGPGDYAVFGIKE